MIILATQVCTYPALATYQLLLKSSMQVAGSPAVNGKLALAADFTARDLGLRLALDIVGKVTASVQLEAGADWIMLEGSETTAPQSWRPALMASGMYESPVVLSAIALA